MGVETKARLHATTVMLKISHQHTLMQLLFVFHIFHMLAQRGEVLFCADRVVSFPFLIHQPMKWSVRSSLLILWSKAALIVSTTFPSPSFRHSGGSLWMLIVGTILLVVAINVLFSGLLCPGSFSDRERRCGLTLGGEMICSGVVVPPFTWYDSPALELWLFLTFPITASFLSSTSTATQLRGLSRRMRWCCWCWCWWWWSSS